MKKLLFIASCCLMFMFIANTSSAVPVTYPIDQTDPPYVYPDEYYKFSTPYTDGDFDTIHAFTNFSDSGEATEKAFFQEILGIDMSDYTFIKQDGLTGKEYPEGYNPGDVNWTWTYALYKVDGPNDFTYLFENTIGGNLLITPVQGADLYDGEEFVASFNWGNYDVSHISFLTTRTEVPEPGMVILLGIGLIGLAFFSRRRLMN